MKSTFIILALISPFFSYSQTPSDELIYKTILDSLVNRKKFEFYRNKLEHIETNLFVNNLLDSVLTFDPDTYEEIMKLRIDVKIHYDSINLRESKLFKERINFPNGLFLVGKISNDHLHKNVEIQNYLELENYPNIHDVTEFSDSIFKYSYLGPFITLALTKENKLKYKYVIKAYLSFSGVLWDKSNMYCLLECGYHYCISDKFPDYGPTGSGFQAILKNESGTPKIIKFIGLWIE